MPNWVYGDYAIKGKKENVLRFLNEGLKNSCCEPQTNCLDAYNLLLNNAKVRTYKEVSYSSEIGRVEDKPKEIIYRKGLTFDTFRPMPDTFLKFDTTNDNDNKMPNIKKQQEEEFGVVGWYDWGVQYRGTKWDSDLEDFRLNECGEIATITFHANTAWSYPDYWLAWVRDTFDVHVLLCVTEESNEFAFYGELDTEQINADERNAPKEEDFADIDDYYEAVCDWEEERSMKMYFDFVNYVDDFEID